jgi:hypothetical protein
MAGPPGAPGPDGTLGGMGLCPIAAGEKPVAEVLTDVAFPQLVQEQVAAADVALLRSGGDRDDEAVADADALKWSRDRRPYLSCRFLLCRDRQRDALSGRASNRELPD